MNLTRDFNAPLEPPRPADSSAAMIAANGLLLLAQQEASLSPSNTTGYNYYVESALEVRLAWAYLWLLTDIISIATSEQHGISLAAVMAKLARERDSRQSRAEQSHGHCLWYV